VRFASDGHRSDGVDRVVDLHRGAGGELGPRRSSRRAGSGGGSGPGTRVEVLLKVYANAFDGHEETARQRVMEALGHLLS
jgi:hypothetical protein